MPSNPQTGHRGGRRRRTNRSPSTENARCHGALGKVLLLPLGLIAALAVVLLAWQGRVYLQGEEKTSLITEAVKRGPLEITITERGSLESANNKTLVCEVEGEAGTGILKIVDEGSRVKEGDELVLLDASKLRNDATAQEIVVEQANATHETALKNVEIQITQNDSDIAAAELKWKLAQLDLEKYEEGDYVQENNTIQGEIELAQEDYTRAKDKYAFTQRLINKGYAKRSEVEADRVAVQKALIGLKVAEEKLSVLKKFTHERQSKELEANALEFGRELERVKLKAAAALAKYQADLSAAKLKFEVEKTTLAKIKKQIDVCRIVAPRDGMVVYVNTRSGGGRGGMSNEALIYEGAKVKERQPIINLPDVRNMQVNARIHESKIAMVREGLPATIHVDARAGETFHGKVSMVSLVPQSGNWPNFNLKEYVTAIKLEDDGEKVSELRPGLTAEVEILIDRLSDVLQAPVQSFVERGGRHFAWVPEGSRTVRKEVKIGKSNEQMMEILSGLAEGEKVVQTPRTVLPKEIVQLEADVPATVESPTTELKTPLPGLTPPVPGGGPRRGGPGEGAYPGGGSPGERAGGAPGEEGRGPGRGGRGGGDPLAFFQRLDQNGDGKVTEDELPEPMRVRFAAMDANGDKAIDKDEWQKAAAAFQGGGGRRRGGPPDAGGGQ